MTRGIFLKISAAIALQALSIFAYADSDFPNKPVKLVVPYAPGGLPDTVARVLAEKMQADLKQPVIVENKPGGGGGVAVTAIKQYPADGHTLLMTDGPLLAVSPIIIKNLKYDAQKDLDPVSLVGVAPLLLVTNSSAPFKNMKDFIQYAKEHPGELNYGSSGIGSIHHLTAEAMAYSLGIDVRHVPFKGSSASIPALIGNQVDITFASPPTLMGFVQSGKARILRPTPWLAARPIRTSLPFPSTPRTLTLALPWSCWPRKERPRPIGTGSAIRSRKLSTIPRSRASWKKQESTPLLEVLSSWRQSSHLKIAGSSQRPSWLT